MKDGNLVFCQCDNEAAFSLCDNCGRPVPQWYYIQDYDMLNYFKGGPLDGKTYETQALMQSPAYNAHVPIELYRWTPDVITTESAGALARVWVFRKDGTVEPQASVNRPRITITRRRPIMAKESNETATTATSPLLERRKALKLSRSVVAEQAGITQAKLARIEAGGPRTTAEEMQLVSDALDALTPQGDVRYEEEPATV